MKVWGLTKDLPRLQKELEGIDVTPTDGGDKAYTSVNVFPRNGPDLQKLEAVKRKGLLLSYKEFLEESYKLLLEEIKMTDPKRYQLLLEYHLDRAVKECAAEGAKFKDNRERRNSLENKYFPSF